MSLARRLWKVSANASRRCSGASSLPFETFRRKLGEPALLVWEALVRHRGEEGLCWPSTARVVQSVVECGGAVVTRRVVKRALLRLRRLRLLEDHGWSARPDRRPGDVYLRTVRGSVHPDGDGGWAARIPGEAARALRAAASRGGRRKGTGRRAAGTTSRNQRGPTSPENALPVRAIKGVPGIGSMSSEKLGTSAVPPEPRAALAAPPCQGGGGPPEPVAVESALADLLRGSRPPPAAVWEAWPGRGPVPVRPFRAIFYEPDAEGIPRRVLEHVRIPAARALTAEELRDENRVIDRMWSAFNGAVRAVAGLPWSASRTPPKVRNRGSSRERMLEMARWLSDLGPKCDRCDGDGEDDAGTCDRCRGRGILAGVAPEAWFVFWANRWVVSTGRRPTSMPLHYALSEQHMAKASWFLHEKDGFVGGREIRTATHVAMDERHDQMMWSLHEEAPKTEEEAKAIVGRCWPDGLWRRMVARARREVHDDQLRINDMVRRGEWVWSVGRAKKQRKAGEV